MSTSPTLAEPVDPLAALRAAHGDLLRRHRAEGATPEVLAAAEQFLAAGRGTGALLAEEDDRWTAQSLLDYWSTTLYRAGAPAIDATLADFDPAQAPELREDACPYLGLDAFREENAAQFFGRKRVVAELVELLRDARLLAIVGPSGSGKSSLVQAGLLPAVRAGAIPASEAWSILPPMVPGSAPLTTLQRTLAAGPEAPGEPLLLLVDQFEETFTLCSDETQRAAFLDRLVELASSPGAPHRVVLTMRSDFEPFVARAEGLRPLFDAGKVTLPALSAPELREAIERPAQWVGLKFETGVVEALLQDILGEPAALPLLQFTLLKLWGARERNRVTLAAYRRIGGGRLALARSADALYNSLIPEEQRTARRILLRMVRPGVGLEVTSKRVMRVDLDRGREDPGRVARVLARLKAERLVRETSGETPEDTQVEVAHEALVRNWPTLVEWLEDERVSLRQRQRLTAAADQWQRLGRPESALLRGSILAEAAVYDDLSTLEASFVGASRAAEEEARARERRNARRLRTLTIVATAAAVIATIAAMFALRGMNEAQANRLEAEAQRATAVVAQAETERQRQVIDLQRLAFAARAMLQQRPNPDLGLLLAYEAAATKDELLTREVLRDGLDAIPWDSLLLDGHEGQVMDAAYSADGARVITASADRVARVWDAGTGELLATLAGHEDYVRSAAFSPDGALALTVSSDGTARLWDAASGAPRATLVSEAAAITGAVFSPDGKRVLAALNDGTAALWATATGRPLSLIQGRQEKVDQAVFSPDGSLILTASWDGTSWLYDAATGRLRTTLQGQESELTTAVAFSRDGSRVLIGTYDGKARIWNVRSGDAVATIAGHSGSIVSASFSADGSRLLTASTDGLALLWDVETSDILVRFEDHTDDLTGAVFSPDEEQVLTASLDGTARLWDVLTGKPLAILRSHGDGLMAALFSPDGAQILTASLDGTARLWDLAGDRFTLLEGRAMANTSVVFSPDGSRLLTEDDDVGQIWDATSGQPVATLQGRDHGIESMQFGPDGSQVLTAADDGAVQLWDAVTGELRATLAGNGQRVNLTTFSPDGSRLLVASAGGAVGVWDPASAQVVARLADHASVQSAAFSPDGTRVATVNSGDRTARLWDAATGELLATLEGHSAPIQSVAYSPDGARILTASRDSTARLWDGATGDTLTTLDVGTPVDAALFSRDGARILTVADNATARVWDAATGESITRIIGHHGIITSATFSRDGSLLLTASRDTTARLWDATTGTGLGVFQGRPGWVYGAVFSPDETRVLTSWEDGAVKVFLLKNEDLLALAACRTARELSAGEIRDFQVPQPLRLDIATRQCPPRFSWEQP